MTDYINKYVYKIYKAIKNKGIVYVSSQQMYNKKKRNRGEGKERNFLLYSLILKFIH